MNSQSSKSLIDLKNNIITFKFYESAKLIGRVSKFDLIKKWISRRHATSHLYRIKQLGPKE